MRINRLLSIVAIFLPLALHGQGSSSSSEPQSSSGQIMGTYSTQGKRNTVMITRKEMGKWWKSSEIAQKLQLGDQQIKQLDDIFYEHRLKLIDYQADLEKQDLELQTLLDQDSPSEGSVGSQVDQELSARSKLEREYTMMNLALRKVLSVEQWRQLKTIQGERDRGPVFFKKVPAGQLPLPPFPPEGADLNSLPPLPPDDALPPPPEAGMGSLY
jgi:Spy/CpxP family protein refolding chaperone